MALTSEEIAELVQPDRVHSRCYTDPEIFALEMDRLFRDGWVYVGHASEVPEPGDYVTTQVGLEPVMLSHGSDGVLRVLLNRCRHRGATVCQQQSGNANFFRCAYHGWTYRNSGDLAGVPFPNGYGADFRKDDFGLTEVPQMGSYRGLVFASMSPVVEPFDEYLPEPVRRYIDLWFDLAPTGEIDVRHGCLRTDVQANWKHQLENGSGDGYHPMFAHESWMNLIAGRLGGSVQTRMGSWRDDGPDGGERQRYLGGPAHMTGDYLEKRRERAQREGLRLPTDTEQSVIAVRPGTDTEGTRAHEVFPELSEEAVNDYLTAMNDAYGPERAFEVISAGGSHMSIFPNLQFTPLSLRVIRPVAVDRTTIEVFIPWYVGAPDELNLQRVRGAEGFFGQGPWGGQDDYEMFERIQTGMAATLNPWTYIGRGHEREGIDDEGLPHAGITDEMAIRRIWSFWRTAMSQPHLATTETQEISQ